MNTPPTAPLSRLVSLFPDVRRTAPASAPPQLRDVLHRIASGEYAAPVAVVRMAIASAPDADAAKRAVKPLKEKLPAVTFGGTFARRETGALATASGIVCLDFDGLPPDLDAADARRAVAADARTLAAFVSPSGRGVKVLAYTNDVPPLSPPDAADWHKATYRALAADYAARYGLTPDDGACDLARLCFVSDDPDLYVNEHAEPVDTRPAVLSPAPAPRPDTRATPTPLRTPLPHRAPVGVETWAEDDVRAMLRAIPGRPAYNDWVRLISATRDAVEGDDAAAERLLGERWPEEQPGEYARKLRDGPGRVTRGTLLAIAREHGYASRRRRRSASPAPQVRSAHDEAGEDATAPEPTTPKPRATTAGRLVELVTTSPGAFLWHTADGAEYATVLRSTAPPSSTDADGAPVPPAAPRPEHLPIRSKAFRDFLALVYYRAEGRPPGGHAVQDAVDQLAGIARFDGPTHRTALRCVTTDGGGVVWIDIGGDSPDAVRVDAAGWAIVPAAACPVRLLRRPNGAALPVPERSHKGDAAARLARLWDFVSVKEERDRAMLLAWILHAMRGAGRYLVLSFAGEAGSGKSTAARLVRALVDPNAVPLRGVPRDEQSLYIAATNNHVLTMDNVSGLSVEMSDALCRLALGGGLSVRQLYTADEERTFQAERPVVLTSVADIVARQDLVDRTLCVTLRRIGETARRSDGDLDEAFARAAPGIFGALLDALSLALRAWPSFAPGGARRPARLPRMADFALWGAASEEALGLPPGGFFAAYERARADLVGAALDGDPLADAVRTLADDAGADGFRATASQMLSYVTDAAGLADAPARRLPPGWPRTANVLSRQLREMAPGLRAVGVAVDFTRDTGHGRARYIVLTPTGTGDGDPPPGDDRDDASPATTMPPPARPIGGDGAPLPVLAPRAVPVPRPAPLPPVLTRPAPSTTATEAPGLDDDEDPYAED